MAAIDDWIGYNKEISLQVEMITLSEISKYSHSI